jgi:large subunit ribosomal protein L33
VIVNLEVRSLAHPRDARDRTVNVCRASLVFDGPGSPIPAKDRSGIVMREYVWLECTTCGDRNYRVQKETRGANRLELKKYCRRERKHTPHKESRKK